MPVQSDDGDGEGWGEGEEERQEGGEGAQGRVQRQLPVLKHMYHSFIYIYAAPFDAARPVLRSKPSEEGIIFHWHKLSIA